MMCTAWIKTEVDEGRLVHMQIKIVGKNEPVIFIRRNAKTPNLKLEVLY